MSIDYCVAAFGIILIISTFQWIIDGRKNYTGPRIDVEVVPAVAAVDDANAEPKGKEAEHIDRASRDVS